MNMNIRENHVLETKLREEIERKYPKHPVLNKYFHSTFKATEEYYKVLNEVL